MKNLYGKLFARIVLVAGAMFIVGTANADQQSRGGIDAGEILLAQAEPNTDEDNQAKKLKKQQKKEAAKQRKDEQAQKKEERRKQQQAEQARKKKEREQQKAAERARRQQEREQQKAAERARKQEERKQQKAAERAKKIQEQEELKAAENARKKEERARRKAERKAKREAAQAQNGEVQEAVTADEVKEQVAKQAEAETKKPAKVSRKAKKPKTKSIETLEAQIENATEVPVTVVPDNLSTNQRKRLANAEKKRRAERRKKRRELIGAVAAGIVVGAVLPQLGGRVAADEGDRFVVERDGRYYVRKDDSYLFRGDGSRTEYEQLRRGRVKETIIRPNGVRVVTVRDPGGNVLRRYKDYPNGDRVVLYDFRDNDRIEYIDYDRRLPPLRVRRPLDEYIVSARRADRAFFYDTFQSEPVEYIEEGYSLQAIRDNERLRASVSRIDLDTVTFATGSAYVSQSQVFLLGDIAGAMLDVIYDNPAAVFMIEGHTDAVGSEISNLTLSDRRAETVARILVEAYDVPPENLVTQGYGESYLKVDTLGPSQANRRVTVRNISPILYSSNE